MLRRLFYVSLGASVGVLVVRRLTRVAQAMSPESLAGGLARSVSHFTAELRVAMAEREAELRTELGLDGRHDDVDAHTLDQR
jgi:hypothetical protein